MVALAQTTEPDGEDALVTALQAHDESALAALHERYRHVLIAVIMKVTHDYAESEDTLQEVLLQVWNRIGSYDTTKGRLSGWLNMLARRRALDRIRKTCAYRRATGRFELESQHNQSHSQPNGASDICAADFRKVIERILSPLPLFQREAVTLSFLEGRSQREIAKLTHTPLGTVKTRIDLGMKKLFESIDSQRDKIL